MERKSYSPQTNASNQSSWLRGACPGPWRPNDIKHVHDRPRARHHLARHRIFIEELLARNTSKFTDIIRKRNTTKRTVLFDLLLNVERWKPITEKRILTTTNHIANCQQYKSLIFISQSMGKICWRSLGLLRRFVQISTQRISHGYQMKPFVHRAHGKKVVFPSDKCLESVVMVARCLPRTVAAITT